MRVLVLLLALALLPGFAADWKGIVLTSLPPDSKRAGVLFPLSGDRWHVTLVGTGHD